MRYAKSCLMVMTAALALGVLALRERAAATAGNTALSETTSAKAATSPRAASVVHAAPTHTTNAEATEAALLQTPQGRAYRERAAFEQQARRFFSQAAETDPASREHEAASLEDAITHYEQARQLSAGEAMHLRLGLIQATVADEVERGARMAELIARYQSDGARREAQFVQQQSNDAAFAEYRRRESMIVAQVMEMTQFPGGITQQEYLRQRLQQERELLLPGSH
jgi:hypothetical protein